MTVFKRNVHLGTKDPLIETDDIANKAVTSEKLADGAVTTEKIAEGGVEWKNISEDVQNIIASREEGGVALSGEFGDSELIGINQKKLTEVVGPEGTLQGNIDAETQRAGEAETALDGRVSDLEKAVGEGGSIDEKIATAASDAKTELINGASEEGDTFKKIEDRLSDVEESVGEGGSVDERIAEEGARHYTKEETYSKTELNNLITTPNQQYVSVASYQDLPATGAADTVYRVSNYNGSVPEVDNTKYSEYAWDGTQYVFLCVKSQIGEVFDITAYNSNTKYADLADALSGTNVPESVRKGGMSIKFVQSSDNNYIRYNLLAQSFTTDVTQWAISDDGIYTENLEFIEIKKDVENRIIWAIRTDGTIYYGAGCPPQVKEYIQEKINALFLEEYEDIVSFMNGLERGDKTLQQLLNEKVDKVEGKGLSTNDFTNTEKEKVNLVTSEDNPEYMEVKTDSGGKVLEYFDKNGERHFVKFPSQIVNKINEIITAHEFAKGSLIRKIEPFVTQNGIANGFTIVEDMRGYEHMPLILTIDAKYESNSEKYPSVKCKVYNTDGTSTMFESSTFKVGKTLEYTQIQVRIPPYTNIGNYNQLYIEFTVPEGVTLYIRDCSISTNTTNRRFEDGIMYQMHTAYGAPEYSLKGYQSAYNMGFNYIITIPKFTADGVGICFHDDDSISGKLVWKNGNPVTGEDDKPIDEYTYNEIIQNFTIRSMGKEYNVGYNLATLDEYFRICSEYGFNPILSVHPIRLFVGEIGRTNWGKIKAMCEKYNILNRLWIKGNNAEMQRMVTEIFDTSIGGRILLFNINQTPTVNPLAWAKSCGLVEQEATTAKDSPYNVWVEWYGEAVTDERIATSLSQGFKVSIAGGTADSETIKSFITKGVTGFTSGFCNVGLDF